MEFICPNTGIVAENRSNHFVNLGWRPQETLSADKSGAREELSQRLLNFSEIYCGIALDGYDPARTDATAQVGTNCIPSGQAFICASRCDAGKPIVHNTLLLEVRIKL
jgi:hypothetical protein